jgi:hypothetical protein
MNGQSFLKYISTKIVVGGLDHFRGSAARRAVRLCLTGPYPFSFTGYAAVGQASSFFTDNRRVW